MVIVKCTGRDCPQDCPADKPYMYLHAQLYYRWATTWQNQQNECAPGEDSDQPGHPPRVFAVRMKKAWVLSYPLSAQRRLCSDWADAQADLSLRWAHTHSVGFVMSRLTCICMHNRIIDKDLNPHNRKLIPSVQLSWFFLGGAFFMFCFLTVIKSAGDGSPNHW